MQGKRGSVGVAPTTYAVEHLGISAKQALRFLTPGQYLHVAGICDTYLPNFGTPTATVAMNIGRVEDNLWCFTESGSVLGNLEVRSYFGVLSEFRQIVVAGHEKVQHEGGPRPHVIQAMKTRVEYQERRLAG